MSARKPRSNASPVSPTPPAAGLTSDASLPRPSTPRREPILVSSSPPSRASMPRRSTVPTVSGDDARTGSRISRTLSKLTDSRARALRPTFSACCCMPLPIGSCMHCAVRSRRTPTSSVGLNSTPCACGCSRSPPWSASRRAGSSSAYHEPLSFVSSSGNSRPDSTRLPHPPERLPDPPCFPRLLRRRCASIRPKGPRQPQSTPL